MVLAQHMDIIELFQNFNYDKNSGLDDYEFYKLV